jgi:hypothetical protein
MIKTSLHLRKIFIIVAASLILPALTHAKDIDWGKGDKGDKGEKSDKGDKGGRGEKGDPRVSSVPETSTAIVLIPFLGAVLVVGSMHLWRRQKNASV